ncbi:MAG: UMP kinase [Clostridiales bacterium]|nr:UMP kinase [Clostridiales bacterium]
MADLKYKRVLLKISGEALSGGTGKTYSSKMLEELSKVLVGLTARGAEIAIVVGGGNIWRGKTGVSANMDQTTADHMGMLATVMNALALQDAIEREGIGKGKDGADVEVRVQTAIEMRAFAEPYIRRKAVNHLTDGNKIVIFGCGTGNPFFTTDTAAALRATEIGADIILLAKNVDGVYSADPKVDPSAVKYDSITFQEVFDQGLKVMDNTAVTHCMNNNMPILVFGLEPPENIIRAIEGENIGTYVSM